MRCDPTNPHLPLAWPWWLLSGYLLGLAGAGGGYCAWLMANRNFHELVSGRVFRSSQVDLPMLQDAVCRHGIRTVINLRGGNPELDWYQDECQATHQLNLSQQDIHLSAYRLPPASEIRRLVQVLDHSEYPILIHCKHGVDRTGLISALILLLYTGATLEEAEQQFSLAFGRVSLGPTAQLDAFLALYRDWLASLGLQHSPRRFRHWLEHDYCPNGLRADLEWLDSSATVPIGRPFGVHVRATNHTGQDWRFRRGETAGIHALYYLTDARGQLVECGRAALFEAIVEPPHPTLSPRGRGQGEGAEPEGSIELTIPLAALRKPGAYHLLVDLEEGRRGMFFQFGSKPLVRELQAVE